MKNKICGFGFYAADKRLRIRIQAIKNEGFKARESFVCLCKIGLFINQYFYEIH